MTRIKCGPPESSIVKLNLPSASVLVRAASSIPCASLISTTSSPAEGWLVVPFFTVPVRVSAETKVARAHTRKTALIFDLGFNLVLLFGCRAARQQRSEEHTSELQSLR